MKLFSKYFFILLALFFFLPVAYGQQGELNALQLKLNNAKDDTVRLRIKNEIGEFIPILRVGYWDSISVEAKKLQVKNIEADAINNIGFVYNNLGDIPKALSYYEKSMELREKIGDKGGVAQSLNNIGLVYESQNDLQKAIEYFTKSLKIEEVISDKVSVANALNNIGSIFYKQRNMEKASEYFKKSITLKEEIGDKKGLVFSLANMGDIYYNEDSIPMALDYYKKSLELSRVMGNKSVMAGMFNAIGVVYEKFGNTGPTASKNKNFGLALAYCDSGLAFSKELGFPTSIRYAEQGIFTVYAAMGKYKEALEHYKQYIIYDDSIHNEKTRKASIKNQLKYEFDKKEILLKEQQERENTVAEEISHRQKIVIWAVVIGLLLVIIFAAYVWRSLKLTHQQKLVIEEKQKEILDSIHYAKRIQNALITPEKYINKSLTRLQKT